MAAKRKMRKKKPLTRQQLIASLTSVKRRKRTIEKLSRTAPENILQSLGLDLEYDADNDADISPKQRHELMVLSGGYLDAASMRRSKRKAKEAITAIKIGNIGGVPIYTSSKK